MRRNFASQYGFVVPEIKLTDDLTIAPKTYQIKVHGTVVASEELRIGDVLVITGEGARPDVPGEDAREPAFGIKAMWVPEMFAENLKREGFKPVDNMSVLLTHLRERRFSTTWRSCCPTRTCAWSIASNQSIAA